MEIQELIEEAKRRFPVGCKFKALTYKGAESGSIYTIGSGNFNPWINSSFPIETQTLHQEGTSGIMYTEGIWAEIQMPENHIVNPLIFN